MSAFSDVKADKRFSISSSAANFLTSSIQSATDLISRSRKNSDPLRTRNISIDDDPMRKKILKLRQNDVFDDSANEFCINDDNENDGDNEIDDGNENDTDDDIPTDRRHHLSRTLVQNKTDIGYPDVGVDDYIYENDVKESIENMASFEVPSVFLKQGMLLLKISHKSKKRILFKVDPSNFKFVYKQTSKSKTYEFLVDDIRSIMARENANIYREEFGISKEFERRWITVVFFNHHKNKLKTLNLIADTSRDLKKLLFVIEGFKKLKDNISETLLVNLGDLDEVEKTIVSGKAESTIKQPKKQLSLSDVLKFSKRLNVNVNTDFLEGLYHSVRSDNKTGIDFKEFKNFVKLLKKREDISPIWKSLTKGKEFMYLEDFISFVTEIQGECYDLEKASRIFRRFSSNEDLSAWQEEDWTAFLLSKYSNPLIEEHMDDSYFKHPLNEYYILSSHNTYLIGRQVAGDSSVEGYMKALHKGCRCLEIDIWNNQSDPEAEPIVNHGRTFTNGISLPSVLKAIKKYAFVASPFPVILSLEIHCSNTAQLKVVKLLQEILGDALVQEPINSESTLPNPDKLKYRFLVKVKKSTPFSAIGVDETGKLVSSSTTASFSESNDNFSSKSSLKLRRKSTNNIIDTLSDLGIYVQGTKFRNFSLPESKTFNHCFSLSEKSANSMIKDDGKRNALDKHNRKFLMRVYPSKIRLKSSNFIPMNYWAHGVQMVATNWQTYDLGQQLNESFFAGSYGYVLKPHYLRHALLKSTMRRTDIYGAQKIKFCIDIISAQQLPKPTNSAAINPFIIVEIIGANSVTWDRSSTVGATPIVAGNGHNPCWNLRYAGVAESDHHFMFLRITVHSSTSATTVDDTKEICTLLVKFSSMKQGYRYYPLNDPCGERLLYSTIFMKVNWCTVK